VITCYLTKPHLIQEILTHKPLGPANSNHTKDFKRNSAILSNEDPMSDLLLLTQASPKKVITLEQDNKVRDFSLAHVLRIESLTLPYIYFRQRLFQKASFRNPKLNKQSKCKLAKLQAEPHRQRSMIDKMSNK
jgi:hypothetical protein